MKAKPIVPRKRANRDIEEVLAWYLREGTPRAASGFIDALERAYARIGHSPSAGSTRYAGELNLPELRFWPVAGYPYLIFYIELIDHVDVWRVLHARRDIPVWMQDTGQS